jgi:hypothetical protein
MKNRIQADILAEYEARKNEFPSFTEFIHATTDESEFVQKMRRKFGGPGTPAESGTR